MSPGDTALPPSVESLNRLLVERSSPDHRIGAALGLSYAAHAALLALLVALSGGASRLDFGSVTSTGVLPVTPLYSPRGAPPGPRPRAAVLPRAEEKASVVERPRPPEPVAAEETFREARPARPRSAATPVPAAPSRANDDRKGHDALGGGTLEGATGGPGTPTGRLDGDPEGGFSALLFTNQWYVARVRDLVYMNWGDPFTAQPRPAGLLEVVVRFRILSDGSITAAEVEKPSGDASWDRAGLRAVENSKLPPLPPDYPGRSVAVHYSFRSDLAR